MQQEEVNKLYKGALLHVHYSGLVKYSKIIDYLYDNKISIHKPVKDKRYLFINYKNDKTLDKNKVLEEIDENKHNLRYLSGLFYGIIKDSKFMKQYLKLIIETMNDVNIDHIEFRLKLGTHFIKYESKYMSVEEELDKMYQNVKLFKDNGKTFKIIPQYSKLSSKDKMYKYFSRICRILEKKPHLKYIIAGFDIVGHEKLGHLLEYYKDKIIKIKNKTSLPFFFHAGEHDVKENLEFAIKYGGNRMGHGINIVKYPLLKKELINKNILLEICPISNVLLDKIKDFDIYKNIMSCGIKICLNSDDPNKFGDTNLNDNFYSFINILNIDKKQIRQLIINSIDYSNVSDKRKLEMKKKIMI